MKNNFKSLNEYKIYANSFPDLDKEEEKTEEKLFQANLKLIPKIIEGYDSKNLPIQELINVAESGLLKAIKHYIKLKKDDRFSLVSLSTWWIWHYIKEAFPSIHSKKKKHPEIDWSKAVLAIYYAEPPYGTKIAEIRQKESTLEIISFEPLQSDKLEKKLKKIAKDNLKYSVCGHKNTCEGHETQFGYRTVTKNDNDYLVGFYWAVLDSHATINGKYLLPRLLDGKGQVILRYGRKLPKNN